MEVFLLCANVPARHVDVPPRRSRTTWRDVVDAVGRYFAEQNVNLALSPI